MRRRHRHRQRPAATQKPTAAMTRRATEGAPGKPPAKSMGQEPPAAAQPSGRRAEAEASKKES
eukprot:9183540-Alexandrium_andersonii.AAC.1